MKVDIGSQVRIYRLAVSVSTVLTVLSWLGIALLAPEYVSWMNALVKLYVGGFLVVRFNPWFMVTTGEEEFDRVIGFQAGLLLLYTVIFGVLDGWLKSRRQPPPTDQSYRRAG